MPKPKMIYRFFVFLFSTFLLLFWSANAQKNPYFFTLTTQDGLPSNTISAITQDKNDFIWVGTANGVSRYDGNSFQNFKKEVFPLLAANEISALEAVGDEIWIGTWKGLSKINIFNFEVIPVELGASIAVRTIYLDSKGTVWVGTTAGLFYFKEGKTGKLDRENSGLSHNMIRSVFMDRFDNLWVGTYDKLNKLSPGSEKFEQFELKENYKPSLQNNLIMDIQPDNYSPEWLWVGTETGLVHFHIHTGEKKTYNEANTALSNEVIKSIYTSTDGSLALGTDFGINILNPENGDIKQLFNHPELAYSVGSNVNWQIFEDSGGVVWFVTSNGLSFTNKNNSFYSFHEINHRQNNQKIGSQVKSILHTKNGDTWLATLNGVIRISPDGKEEVFDIHSGMGKQLLLNNVYALEEDDLGRIWIGTAGGINIWDPKILKMHSISSGNQNGLDSNYIAKFIKASDGTFWVSAWEGGLYKVSGKLNDIESLYFEKASEVGSEKVATGANALWAVNYDELFRIDLQTHRNSSVSIFNEVSNRRSLNAIYFSKKGVLWAATTNGLIEYQPQNDKAVYHPIQMGSDFLFNSITEDNQGNIWGAASGLLIKFKPGLDAYELFPLDSGLPIKSFFEGCFSKDKEGRLFFGGDNGFIRLATDAEACSFKPKLFFSNLRINNERILPGKNTDSGLELPMDIAFMKKLSLNYAQRSFAIDFSALHYWQPKRNIYAYKLEGFDEDWSYASGSTNTAVYSKLPSGKYILKLKGSNNHGIWSDEIHTLDIEVKPPLFLSTPFIVIYIFLVLALLAFAFRFYTLRIHFKNEVNLAKIEKQHSEEIAKTKQQFFTNISHELRTPISLILPPIQQALSSKELDLKSKELLRLAEKNSNRLLRVVNQILDFRKLEQDSFELKVRVFDLVSFSREVCELFKDKAARKNINFRFNSEIESCEIWADSEKLETVLYNLLSNAFKFTPDQGAVELSIRKHPDKDHYKNGAVDIQVHDTGIGIEPQEIPKVFDRFYQGTQGRQVDSGSGIGLSMVKEYTKLHFGEVNVESQPGEGSYFTVTLPLGNVHFPVEVEQKDETINLLVSKDADNFEEYEYDFDTSKPVILVVEDYPDMVDYLLLHLRESYHIVVAQNGQEALDKTRNFTPEVIISDIMMPVMDGLTLCKKVKQNPKTSHIGVILLSAKSLTSQKVEGLRTGADAYITKPFDLELLKANIEQLIKRKDVLLNYFKAEIITQPEFKEEGENIDDKFVKKVVGIIEANISNPEFTVELLSEEIGMSTAHLYRKLKALTHYSAKEIIRKYRLKKASILFRNKEGNISEIMYEVGFSNLSYFAKCFKKEYGVSPRDYQQNPQNEQTKTLDRI
ncbi:hybrid sensor histidine kinase/response regulator transcription factor [Indibacter alkaliphilus]|nr:hybrid sensor histidine kinase/response regulator transcription factor [Indibacter alkaliphilus]